MRFSPRVLALLDGSFHHLKTPGVDAPAAQRDPAVAATVSEMLRDVETRGLDAVRDHARRLDRWERPSFELTAAEVAELGACTQTAMRVLREVSAPHGMNLGMNQGEVAGAGIAAHLHQHVVPRWGGDANFLPVVARTKAVPQLLADTRALLAGAWPAPDRTQP